MSLKIPFLLEDINPAVKFKIPFVEYIAYSFEPFVYDSPPFINKFPSLYIPNIFPLFTSISSSVFVYIAYLFAFNVEFASIFILAFPVLDTA